MSKYLFLLSLFLCAIGSFAQNVTIQIYSTESVNTVEFFVHEGRYHLLGDHLELVEASNPSSTLRIKVSLSAEVLSVYINGTKAKDCKKLEFLKLDSLTSFDIFSNENSKAVMTYNGNLEVSVKDGKLYLLNIVALESYVASVLSAEVGYNAQPEFLKAKAIICRTYALANRNRHLPDSTLMCNGVHCQVYKGNKEITTQILRAIKATKGKIIVDANNKPIIAAFHSNCGGRTLNSEDGFSTYLPYLRSVVDSFCGRMPHAIWEKKISVESWKSYIHKETKAALDSLPSDASGYVFSNPDRLKNYTLGNQTLLLRKVRADWNIKSSWFDIMADGNDSLLLHGKGYGHGVGLCQEGAMNMAELDRSHEQIIRYYFTNVKIVTP